MDERSAQYGPVNAKWAVLWHGGDYNPDQWPAEVWKEDVRLMKLAGVNIASVGIFSWAQLEPAPGQYEWGWLDQVMDLLHEGGVAAALATPSAAPPRWLTQLHPEVMLVDHLGRRPRHAARQCFCPTSPVYRDYVRRINRLIAQRYEKHPALALWHVSNEYGPHCWCDLCVQTFRRWLQKRYGDLETLNQQWWTGFWSQRYNDWSQVHPDLGFGSTYLKGLVLDWRRFQSHQVCDFFKLEVDTVRRLTPEVPVTTNLMGFYDGLIYAHFADVMDVISWDSYPAVGSEMGDVAATHALMRGLKHNRPWLLMEQTPSATNWQEYAELKPPGVLRLWSWQAVGHGSDAAMYFQWRRSRGSAEKFHGAVVAHEGSERPRVFQEVAALGAELGRAGGAIVGTAAVGARVGVLYDHESRWALQDSAGPGRHRDYAAAVRKHFRAVWRQNIAVDVVRMDADWSGYRVLIAPMLYMVRSGRFPRAGSAEELRFRVDEAKKIADWTAAGGTFVATYLSGLVNENDLVYEGGYPGPLRKLLGIWVEEIDVPAPARASNELVVEASGERLPTDTGPVPPGLKPRYACHAFFDQIHLEGAQAVARYGGNWYAGRPAVTRHRWGAGLACYLGTDAEEAFLEDFYRALAAERGVTAAIEPVAGVEVLERLGPAGAGAGSPAAPRRVLFVLNHADQPRTVDLGGVRGTDVLTGRRAEGRIDLEAYGVRVVRVEP